MSDTPNPQSAQTRAEKIEAAKLFLSKRKRSYLETFNVEQVSVKEVLRDLARFCKANQTTFHPDPRMHAVAEGRREVWLRIANHLNLSTEDLYALLSGDKK